MSPKVLKLFALGALCGLLLTPLLLDVFELKRSTPPESTRPAGFPTGTPGNSAPPFALAACVGKSNGQSCELVFNGSTTPGLCFWSGDQLACGPAIPKQP